MSLRSGFGSAGGLSSTPLDEVEVWLPVAEPFVSEVRRRTLDVLTRWSVDAGTIADAVVCVNRLAGDAYRRRRCELVGLRVSVFVSSICVAVCEQLQPRSGRFAPDPFAATGPGQSPAAELDGLAARWGAIRDVHAETAWFELPLTHDTAPGQAGDDGARRGVLAALDEAATRAHDLDDAANAVTLLLRRHLRALFLGIAVRDGDLMSYVGVHPLPSVDVSGWPPFSIARNSPIAAACRTGQALLHDDPAAVEEQFPGAGAAMRVTGAQSVAHLPLPGAHRTVGALGVGWAEPGLASRYAPLLAEAVPHVVRTLQPYLDSDDVARRLRLTPQPSAVAPALTPAPAAASRSAAILTGGRLRINLITRSVSIDGVAQPVHLTGREFELLVHFVRHAGEVQTRRDLLLAVWDIGFDADTAVVEVTVSRLRRKLGTDELHTIKDVGYVFGELDPDGAVPLPALAGPALRARRSLGA